MPIISHQNLFCSQHSEDSWSEEEGEVSDEGHHMRPRKSFSTLSSEGGVSEEDHNIRWGQIRKKSLFKVSQMTICLHFQKEP